MYVVLAYTGTCIIDENSLFTNIYSCKVICIPWGLSPPPSCWLNISIKIRKIRLLYWLSSPLPLLATVYVYQWNIFIHIHDTLKSKVFTPYLVYCFVQCCDDALWCNVEEMEQQLQAEPGLLGLEPVNLAKHLNGGIYPIGIVPLSKSLYSCIAYSISIPFTKMQNSPQKSRIKIPNFWKINVWINRLKKIDKWKLIDNPATFINCLTLHGKNHLNDSI